MHPEIARLFGEEAGGDWRELTSSEADDLLVRLGPAADRVNWVVDAGYGFIGSASLHSFDRDAHTAAYAIGLLAPDVLGLGLGTEITRLVLAHAFEHLGLGGAHRPCPRVQHASGSPATRAAATSSTAASRTLSHSTVSGSRTWSDAPRRRAVRAPFAPSWGAVVEPPELF